MSFEEEWAELKAEAAAKHAAHMQLNQLPADRGGGGTQGDLQVSQKDLAAIGDRAFKLWERLGKDGKHADTSTEKAAGDLKGRNFQLGAALSTVHTEWDKQLKSLLDACAQISNHLDYTQKAHQGDEHYIAGQLSSIATLDKGFEEGTTP